MLTSRVTLVGLAATVLSVSAGTVSSAEAEGPGRDNVAVVYNADSVASRTIAQAWMRLRGVRYEQAIPLTGVSWHERTDMIEFRRHILAPVETALRARGLEQRISIIAYAPDLPLNIWFTAPRAPNGQRGPGAITGLTLLAPSIASGWEVFTGPQANRYHEDIDIPGKIQDQRAAADPRSVAAEASLEKKDLPAAEAGYVALIRDIPAPGMWYNLACVQALQGKNPDAITSLDHAVSAGWMHALHSQNDADLAGLRNSPEWPVLVQRMLVNAAACSPRASESFRLTPAIPEVEGGLSSPGRLSMVLAVTTGRGQAIDVAVAGLEKSVAADGTRPSGTVWFMASKDAARTGPRSWAYPGATAALNAAGVKAELVEDILPPTGATVIGAMIGASDFDWAASGAQIVPGAWCDHLTSWSGAMQPGGGQTPITVYLQAGAAGAGGAVHEPYNIRFKFPSAFVHVHRVRGLSLVEAVFYTMAMPFQYLAVGDPLSRPWSAVAPVPKAPAPIAGATLTLPGNVVWGNPVSCHAIRSGDQAVVLAHLGRVVANIPAGNNDITLDSKLFGFGSNELVLGTLNNEQHIRELARTSIQVDLPLALPALPDPGATAARWKFSDISWPPPDVFYPGTTAAGDHDAGWLEIPESGLHQLSWSSSRLLTFTWDNGPQQQAGDGANSAPVVLAAGWHRLEVHFAPGDALCELRFGRHGTLPIEAARWQKK